MPKAYIGIGSNLGDREANCADALNAMREAGITVISASSAHETEPWGVTDQPMFINMAAEISTSLSPLELLGVLKRIESGAGRVHTKRYGPRVLDLDILLYDDVVLEAPGLSVPHPRLHERAFVLEPLCSIAADVVHPVLGERIDTLARRARERLGPDFATAVRRLEEAAWPSSQ